MKITSNIGAGLGFSALLLSVGGPAAANTDVRGSGRYQCNVEGNVSSSETGVTLQLKALPAALRPGADVRLKGTLDMSFPAEVGAQSTLQLAKEAGLASTDFSLVAAIGKHRFEVKPAVVAAQPQPIGSPFVVSAAIEFAPFTLPRGVSGELTLAMPSRARTVNPVAEEPASVVFKATISQDSPFAEKRRVGCEVLEGDQPGVVARIPVAGRTSDAVGDPTMPGIQSPSGAAASSGSTAASPTAPAPLDFLSDGKAATDGAARPALTRDLMTRDGSAPLLTTAQSLTPTSTAIPSATKHPGTFLPVWALLVAFTTLLGLAVACAVRQRLVLASVRQPAAEATRRSGAADKPPTTDR